MRRAALDFGTQNSVLAREAVDGGPPAALPLPGIGQEIRFRLAPAAPVAAAPIVPSLIHYGERETLIGAQVVERGLLDHPHTCRWFKRGIAHGSTKRRKTPQGYKTAADAGADFLGLLLRHAAEDIRAAEDEVTFTAPVESFDAFRDWLERVAAAAGIRRLRIIDEPTAVILGNAETVRADDRYVILDFGCGTLDVAAVRLDLAVGAEPRAVQLGQAGADLGGMDIDRWLAADVCRRCGVDEATRKALEPRLLAHAEAVKIALSDPGTESALLRLETGEGTLEATWTRSCPRCERGLGQAAAASTGPCLGCLLLEKGFLRQARETLDRALENAVLKSGLRRSAVTLAIVTGGTSLVPCVRRLVEETFEGKVEYRNPFDACARGGCSGAVSPILQHDYAIESHNAARQRYEFKPLLAAGTGYPTAAGAVKMWARGSHEGMTRIGLRIFEVSRMPRRAIEAAFVDADGALLDASRVASDAVHVCLNRDNPTFIVADPPVSLARDGQRFLCSFHVDAMRRLLVTVRDQLTQRTLLDGHPVVRL